jgi:hypothetical protein
LICPACAEVDGYRERFTAIEIRGAYDGVLIWQCSRCRHMWPRFPDGRLHRQALEAIAEREVGLR